MYIFRLFVSLFLFISITMQAHGDGHKAVSVQLEWKHQFQFAGFYAALEQGYYRDLGLDVSIKEYDSSVHVIEDILNGISTYGTSSSHLIVQRLLGKDIVLLASYLKQNALVLLTKPHIKSIKDLKNKKIMASKNELASTSLALMLHEHNISADTTQIVPHTFNIDAFVNNEIDAMTAFLFNQPFLLDQQQIPYRVFNPSDNGIFSYGVELFTSNKEVKTHPKRTKSFIQATQKGWKYAFTHKEEIVELIYQKYSSKKSKEALLYEANTIEKLMKIDTFAIGAIVPELIQLNTGMYVELGLVNKDFNLDGFIFDSKSNKIALSPAESAFLKKHPKIVLGTEEKWGPYVIVSKDGAISGYDADVLKRINEVSGSNFVLKSGAWKEMQEQAKAKIIDGLSTGGIHDERKKYLNFSDIYISMEKMLITSKENPKNIFTLDDLDGKTIAIHKSNLADEKIANIYNKSNILRLDSIEEVILSVITGKADAMFGNGATFYLANVLGLAHLKYVSTLDKPLDLAFGVRKDWPEAISIINKSLKHIGKMELLELKRKWFWDMQIANADSKSETLLLSTKEIRYLQNKKKITMCVDPDWMPYESLKNGKHIGIAADYLQHISSLLHIPIVMNPTGSWEESLIDFKDKHCDILSLVVQLPHRDTFINFTKPYISSPLVVATTHDKSFISNLNKLNNEKIGLVKNYATNTLLHDKYPNIVFVELDSAVKGLEDVVDGKLYGFIDTLTTISYQIQKRFPTELKISGQLEEAFDLSIGVQKDQPKLLELLNKAIDATKEDTRQNIFNHWVSVKFEKSDAYPQIYWKIFLPIALIILILLISQYAMREYNKRLKLRIKEHMQELETKDKHLLQQHRMAAMGEMLSMISHQWKQPLGAINSAIMGMQIKIDSGKFNLTDPYDKKEFLAYLHRKHQNILNYVNYLTHTTDDFRDFFNPNKIKELTSLTEPIENALTLVRASLEKNGITLITDYKIDKKLMMHHNEIMQVILNLLKNSEDNFLDKKTQNPKIILSAFEKEKTYIIRICDNGGGIKEEIAKHIFEPYFSTKNNKTGTGLGLYMSKMIIEKHHLGSLSMRNLSSGVCFEIIFP